MVSGIGVTKHRTTAPFLTGPKDKSFRDLFMQISNILKQRAGMAVAKCINRRPHCAFED